MLQVILAPILHGATVVLASRLLGNPWCVVSNDRRRHCKPTDSAQRDEHYELAGAGAHNVCEIAARRTCLPSGVQPPAVFLANGTVVRRLLTHKDGRVREYDDGTRAVPGDHMLVGPPHGAQPGRCMRAGIGCRSSGWMAARNAWCAMGGCGRLGVIRAGMGRGWRFWGER